MVTRFTVAIVGADGSGKSTIARRLVQQSAVPMKYIYMGAAIDKSNVSLPTSRLLTHLKRRRVAPLIDESGHLPPAALMSDEMRARVPRGKLVKAIGVVNRMAEEWYRQLAIWLYHFRGYVVVCDRHFLFEYCPNSESLRPESERLSVRIHSFLLRRFFPKPTLTVFLDAPPETLYARKPEWTLEHLERQRTGIVEQGNASPNFVRVDATQPIDGVVADVFAHLQRFGIGDDR